jgi:hypothetical protein
MTCTLATTSIRESSPTGWLECLAALAQSS